MPGDAGLSHLDHSGKARMVDVQTKPVVSRSAVARARVRMSRRAMAAAAAGSIPKGDVEAVARVGGIQGAKRTPELIALCHPLPIEHASVDVGLDAEACEAIITAQVGATARTGVEMEALTAASVAALNIWDMVKAIDPAELAIVEVVLVEKRKG